LGVGSHVGSSRSVVGVFFSEGCGPPGLAPDEAGAQAVCTPTRPDPQHHDPGRDLTRRLREADTRGLLSGKPTAREWVESLSRARPPRSPSDARPAVSLHPSEPGVDAPHASGAGSGASQSPYGSVTRCDHPGRYGAPRASRREFSPSRDAERTRRPPGKLEPFSGGPSSPWPPFGGCVPRPGGPIWVVAHLRGARLPRRAGESGVYSGFVAAYSRSSRRGPWVEPPGASALDSVARSADEHGDRAGAMASTLSPGRLSRTATQDS
jgi:hypothetical protein